MTTQYDPAWLDKINQAAAMPNGHGFDPSWFVPNHVVPTGRERINQLQDDYLKANPGARDWTPEMREQMRIYSQPELFPGLVMTPEGSAAYDALVDQHDKEYQKNSLKEAAAMVAAVFGGAALMGSAAGAGAAGAGAGAGAGGAGAAGGAGGAASGIGTLGTTVGEIGSVMSPSAMGLTTAGAQIAPTMSAALPGLAPSIGDLAMQGAMRGAVSGGVKGLVNGENPLTSAAQGALGGAITGGIGGGVNAINPDGAGWVNGGITGGITSAIGGGNPLMGAAGGALGSFANSATQAGNAPSTIAPKGGNMDFGLDGYFSNWDADSFQPNISITGDILPSFNETVGNVWQPDMSDFLSQLYGSGQSQAGGDGWLSTIAQGLKSALGPVSDGKGGKLPNPLTTLLSGAVGAAGSQSFNLTTTKAPWEPLQPFYKDLIGDAGTIRQNLAAHPYTPEQTQQYAHAYAGLDQARAALPGLLNWSQSAMSRQSNTPSYAQLFGGGLLSPQPQPAQPQPTMQAGGPGGLLGDNDRIKALMFNGSRAAMA